MFDLPCLKYVWLSVEVPFARRLIAAVEVNDSLTYLPVVEFFIHCTSDGYLSIEMLTIVGPSFRSLLMNDAVL